MRTNRRFGYGRILLAIAVLALSYLIGRGQAEAQTANAGDNAVCKDSSCTPSPSPAFIDASAFSVNNNDVCGQIRKAFGQLPATGGVIDARGAAPNPTTGAFGCTDTPWYDGTNPIKTPSEILLPAGQIQMTETWVIPSQTRVFGAGVYGAAQSGVSGYGTSLLCNTGCSISPTGKPMVQFGGTDVHGNTFCTTCTGVSLEYVSVDGADASGNPQDFVGILNQYAQDGSYVHQVGIRNIAVSSGSSAIGLQIGTSTGSNAQNSGPYTDIFFVGIEGGGNYTGSTECVEIYQSGTLGLHGITCVTGWTFTNAVAGIYLDASNTTIEDAHIEGFQEGIRVGGNLGAQADTLANISGGSVTDTIHICDATCGMNVTVSDLSILGVAATNESTPIAVQDDQTGVLTGSNVGLYALAGCGKTTSRLRTLQVS